LTTLDDTGYTWTFLSWGRPFRLVSPALDCSSPDSTPLQVECGWAYTSILTKSGDIFVFWPFGDDMLTRITEKNAEFDRQGDKKVKVGSEDVIPCITWDLQMDPVRLSSLPPLPELHNADGSEQTDEDIKLIQIAALDNNLIALTNKGHVLKHGNLSNKTDVRRGQWEYVRSPVMCMPVSLTRLH
jgi:SCF-associated factor 1